MRSVYDRHQIVKLNRTIPEGLRRPCDLLRDLLDDAPRRLCTHCGALVVDGHTVRHHAYEVQAGWARHSPERCRRHRRQLERLALLGIGRAGGIRTAEEARWTLQAIARRAA
jgi:hypothetical protein